MDSKTRKFKMVKGKVMCEMCDNDPEFAKNYDPCARPECNHYRCEHGTGLMTVKYSKDHPETIGQVQDWGYECLNGGCECPGFLEKEKNG